MVDSGGGVEWLVDITSIMEQKSHGSGEAIGFGSTLHTVLPDLLILEGFGISIILVYP